MQKCRKTLQNCELRNVSKFSSDQFPLNTFQQLASVQSISFSQQCTAHDYNPDEKSESFFRSQLLRKLFFSSSNKAMSVSLQNPTFWLRAEKQVSIQVSRPAIVDFVTFDNQFRGNSICRQSTIYTSCVKLNNLQFIGKMRLAGQKNPQPIILGQDEVPSVQTAFTEVRISSCTAN